MAGVSNSNSGSGNNDQTEQQRQQSNNNGFFNPTPCDFFVGSLHFVGHFCTNSGYAAGGAALVQIVKLLEPIETLLLTALVAACCGVGEQRVATRKTAFATAMICAGTSLLLSGNGRLDKTGSKLSVVLALLSGLAMSSRNVAIKSRRRRRGVGGTGEKTATPTTTTSDSDPGRCGELTEAISSGLKNNFDASATSSLVAFAGCWLVAGNDSIRAFSDIAGFFRRGKDHVLFNIASMMVLNLYAAQTHSLLNVGKRIGNVIVASSAFGMKFEPAGLVGIAMAMVGGVLYSSPAGMTERVARRLRGGRDLLNYLALSVLLGLVYLMHTHFSKALQPYRSNTK